MLKKVVLSQILQHINCNKLLSDFQSAYRPHHSTETAAFKVTNDLLSAMDDSNISVLVLLDLSAAFDTIDHEILLHRLHNMFGFRDTVLSWFQSYLTNKHDLLLYMEHIQFQLLFVMVFHRGQFLDQ